jgi:cytoskeletal protein CcmA (bactofilin family)
MIEGEVDGNVFAQEQAILRTSGAIRGNISSPRVILEDGSRFKGSIDMEPKSAGRQEGQGKPATGDNVGKVPSGGNGPVANKVANAG